MKALQQGTGIFCMLAGAYFIFDYLTLMDQAKSAPQQAALSAMVLASVVPPYIVTRCFEMMGRLESAGNDGAA